MTVFMVKHGTKPWEGVTIITDDKAYADGYTAGLNHCTKRHWHRFEPIEPIPAGTPVRYWPGPRKGDSQESTIHPASTLRMVRGKPSQLVVGAGPVAMTHIEPIQKDATCAGRLAKTMEDNNEPN